MPTPEQELKFALLELELAVESRVYTTKYRRAKHIAEAKERVYRLFVARDCGHPERHCPVCSGSVEECREFCRNAAGI